MKVKIIVVSSVFMVTLLALFAVAMMDGPHWLSTALIIVMLVASTTNIYLWMTYIQQLVHKSNRALHKKTMYKPIWLLGGFEELENNQDLVEQKFQLSAELIANLRHPEKDKSTTILGADDPIAKALDSIQAEMQRIKEDDEKRTWVTLGLARFSEILRQKGDVKEYGHNILSNLVKYVQANQAALFIEYRDDAGESYLQMVACYAYGKRKFIENTIHAGQGLVGQCMLEKDFIFITDVPKDYVKITSGLGEATPRNVIVAPLIFNDVFCGAIELASFEILQPHQVEFLKKICENIASEIASLKNMEHTQHLLEESNTLTQELQSREEEMKQNMEELATTQEEMQRKQTELAGIIHAIDSTLATVELSLTGRILKHNNILEDFLGYNSKQLQDEEYSVILGKDAQTAWRDIVSGITRAGDFKTTSNLGADVWLSITFTPINDVQGKTLKILCMIQNITQKKIKEKEFERLSLVANNTDNSVIITDKHGLIEYVNEGFTKMTGYAPREVIGKKPGRVLQGPLTDKKTIQKLREHIAAGTPIYEEILNYNKNGQSYWVSLAINPVKDEKGNVIQFISIQADITQTKIVALDFHQKMEALSRSNAILEVDRNGKIIDVNENYLHLLGYQVEELIGQPYSILTHKDTTFQKVLNTITDKGMQNGEFTRYNKKGEAVTMRLMDYPVLNLHGEIQKIIEFGIDISNEIRLEKIAEHKQAELKSYLNGINNTIASAEFDIAGNFKDANEIFLKVMGYAKNELVGRSFVSLMGEGHTTIMMWENLKLGKFFSGEFKMKDNEGKELWLNGTFNPIIIEGDVPEKIMMFAQFTTQEKEKLHELSGMVQALKATLPLVEFSHDFQCKSANEKFLKIFGLTRLELRNKKLHDFMPEKKFSKNFLRHKDELLASSQIQFSLDFEIAGQVKTWDVSFAVMHDLSGNVVRIVMMLLHETEGRIVRLAI